VLHALGLGPAQQAVGVEAVRRAADPVEVDRDASFAAGLGHALPDRLRPDVAELGRVVGAVVHALWRHAGVELERSPADRDDVGGLGERAVEIRLANVAPGTDHV
jgi:hypothetical protein